MPKKKKSPKRELGSPPGQLVTPGGHRSSVPDRTFVPDPFSSSKAGIIRESKLDRMTFRDDRKGVFRSVADIKKRSRAPVSYMKERESAAAMHSKRKRRFQKELHALRKHKLSRERRLRSSGRR